MCSESENNGNKMVVANLKAAYYPSVDLIEVRKTTRPLRYPERGSKTDRHDP
jgi:hypothetical protein